MLCHACHVHLRRDYPYCLHCGTIRKRVKVATFAAPRLRRAGSATDPAEAAVLVKPVTSIGRSTDNDVVIDDPSVSRHHARIIRGPAGFSIEDLDSFNGTTVDGRTMHGDRTSLLDTTALFIGDVELHFEQPRSAAVGSKTVVRGTEHTMLRAADDEEAPTATEPLSVRPQRRSGWALKQIPDDRGREIWVLRNTRTGRYLELDARDVFIWNSIDGENTVRDLLFLYAEKFGELALPRIEKTLRTFAAMELVRGLHGQREQRPPFLRRVGRALFRALLQMKISIGGLDRLFGRIYTAFGWRLFTPTGVLLMWALILSGLYGFLVAIGRQRLFDVGGAGLWGAVAIAVGYLVALVIHESAHALAVKSYGRKVTRGGFMLMLGMPFAFVDTSDMWFGSRWSRLVVTLSGPLSTAAVAGAVSLGAAYVDDPAISGVCFQLAFGLYVNTLYNLNPLMPLDGYQALSDVLRMPRLREEATAYFTKGIWRDLRAGRRPGFRQVGMAAYGFTAIVGMTLFVLIALLAWNSRLGDLVQTHVRPPLDTILIAAVIGVAMFPIWYRVVRAVVVRAKRRTARGATASGEATPVEVAA